MSQQSQQPPSNSSWQGWQSQQLPEGQPFVYAPSYYEPPVPTPPYYRPPAQPSRSRVPGWLWIVFALTLLMCSGGSYAIGAASGAGSDIHANQAPTTTSAAQQTGGSAPPPTHLKVGQAATIGGWQVTVSNVKTSQGQDIDAPKPGNTFLLVDVALKNTSSSVQNASSLLQWELRDSTGQKYTESVTTFAPSPPDGKVAAGSPLRGTLAYEIPANLHTFTLAFSPDLTSGQAATWDIKI